MDSGERCVMIVLDQVKQLLLVRSLDSLTISNIVTLIRPLSESIAILF